jgi:hypothetical protein
MPECFRADNQVPIFMPLIIHDSRWILKTIECSDPTNIIVSCPRPHLLNKHDSYTVLRAASRRPHSETLQSSSHFHCVYVTTTLKWSPLLLGLIRDVFPVVVIEPGKRSLTDWSVRWLNPGEGEIFRIRPDRSWGPHSLLYNGYRLIPGGEAVGTWCWPLTPYSSEVKERVELYIYSPSVSSWQIVGWTLLLLLPHHYCLFYWSASDARYFELWSQASALRGFGS